MNKRGISAVVATVLVILLSVAAVGIVWLGIMPIISDINLNVNPDLNLISNKGYTLWDANSRLATVQVGRGVDESDIVGFDLVFSLEGNSVTHFVEDVPGINGEKVYYVNLSEYPGELDSIKLVPIFEGGVAGGVVSELKIGRIPEADIIELIEEEEIVAEDFVQPSGSGGGGSGSSGGGGEASICGNGVVESDEVCDGASLGSQTCSSQEFDSGDLACLGNCSGYNTSGCVSCTDTCSSLGYECGFQDVCGVSTDCLSCGGEDVCSIGSCIVISGDVEAVVEVFRDTGMAPYTVLFNGFGSSSPDGNIVNYGWDFADSNSDYERYDTGRMAGHRFDDSGTYDVLLTVTDESGASAQTTIEITVVPVPASAITYYVSAGGNDGNDGLTNETTWLTTDRVNAEAASMTDGSEVLFNRGDTWDGLNTSWYIGGLMRGGPEYIRIGAYGTGAKPVFYCEWCNDGNEQEGTISTGIRTTEGNGIIIEDIRISGGIWSKSRWYSSTEPIGQRDPGIQLIMRDVDIYPNGYITSWTSSGNTFENIYINSSGIEESGSGTVGLLTSNGPGMKYMYVNNLEIENSYSHCVYLASAAFDTLFENLNLHHCGIYGRNRDGFTVHGQFDNVIIRDSEIHDNFYAMGIDAAYGAGDYNYEWMRNFLIENNKFYNQRGYGFQLSSVQNLIIRNNLYYNNSLESPTAFIFLLNTPSNLDGVTDTDSENVSIINNVFYNNGGGLYFIEDDQVSNVEIKNNVIMDNDAYGDLSIDIRNSSDVNFSNNIYYNNFGQILVDGSGVSFADFLADYHTDSMEVDPLFISVDSSNSEFLKIDESSPAYDAGADVEISFDRDGVSRPQGAAIDIGAYEFF